MTADGSPKPILFLDFDGTITRRDATDAILEAYADPEWLQIEEEWKRGRMGSRECLIAQMALVRATGAEIDSLLDHIAIDQGFVPLLETCSPPDVPVHIVSDGFDYCIQRILSRPSLHLAAPRRHADCLESSRAQGARWNDIASLSPPCISTVAARASRRRWNG